jgi:hypothetical protein
VIILEAKNVELKIQRLVDINRGEEDDPLIDERHSRDYKTLKKIQKIKTAGENEEIVRQLSYNVFLFLQCLNFLTSHVSIKGGCHGSMKII